MCAVNEKVLFPNPQDPRAQLGVARRPPLTDGGIGGVAVDRAMPMGFGSAPSERMVPLRQSKKFSGFIGAKADDDNLRVSRA